MGVGQVAAPRADARLAILDRDGTIIDVVRDEETGFVGTAFHPSQLRLLDGAVEGMLALQKAGFILSIATNQPGPAKGQYSAAAVTRTNEALVARLAAEGVSIRSVHACMHHPNGGAGGDASLVGPCGCRKPKPGLLLDALRETGSAPSRCWMIGDTRSDLDAGRAAGTRTALIFSRDRCELCPLRHGPPGSPDVHGSSLAAVAVQILALPVSA